MPRYPHLATDRFDTSLVGAKMRALRTVGVPYTDDMIANQHWDVTWRTIACEHQSCHPRGTLHDAIVRREAGIRAIGSVTRDQAVDLVRAFRADRCGVETKALQRLRSHIGNNDISGSDEVIDHFARTWLL